MAIPAAASLTGWQARVYDVVEHVLVDAESSCGAGGSLFPTGSRTTISLLTAWSCCWMISPTERPWDDRKVPRNAMAFKWADETKETHLLEVEWSASRTGLINPVAIFEPVELEGTTVSRASLHNVSIIRSLQLGIGDEIQVYKANMIIPQIAENLTRSDTLAIPDHCPVCGQPVRLQSLDGVQTLHCDNPACQAKHVKRFAHMAGRDALN